MQRFVMLGLLALLLALAGCGKVESRMPERPPAAITSTPAGKRDVPLYIDEIGRCIATEVVAIQPQTSGRITEIHFKDGADIKKGDPLFTIDPRPFQVQLKQAEADVVQNQAELERAEAAVVQQKAALGRSASGINEMQARLELSKLEFERAKDLVKADAVTKQVYDEKKMAVSVAEAQLKSSQAALAMDNATIKQGEADISVARAKLESSKNAIATAKLNLEYTSILSPIEGRAGQRLVDVGNVVTSNFNPVSLVVIQRIDPIYVDFTIPEASLARVRSFISTGKLKVEVRTADAPDRVHVGELSFFDNAVQSGTGTIKLRALMQNPERALWPGQFTRVRLILTTLKDSILIPSECVQVGQTGSYVYVVKADSTAEMRPVELGQRHGEDVLVTKGLASGERVVTTGQLTLAPGAKVVEAAQTPPAAPAPAEESKELKKEATAESKTEGGK
jgi:multidrug efflux system membrane fusion protein